MKLFSSKENFLFFSFTSGGWFSTNFPFLVSEIFPFLSQNSFYFFHVDELDSE